MKNIKLTIILVIFILIFSCKKDEDKYLTKIYLLYFKTLACECLINNSLKMEDDLEQLLSESKTDKGKYKIIKLDYYNEYKKCTKLIKKHGFAFPPSVNILNEENELVYKSQDFINKDEFYFNIK